MLLYLIQHAEADSTPDDPERRLTKTGIAGITKTATFFKQLNPRPAAIWHSGKYRARETAEILRKTIDSAITLIVHENLNPNDPVFDIAIELEALDIGDLVIVGHLPHLARLASHLLTGDPKRMPIHFRNAGIVCLRGAFGKWELEWIVTPEILA